MSAAALGCAANFIRRTCWSASPRCGSAARSNGSRTGASIFSPPITRASSAMWCGPRSTADGAILAIDDEFSHDQGAYVRTHGTRVAMMATGILPGPYRVPAYRSVCHFRLTNKTPAATYRAPGRYETTFVRERLIEAIAHALEAQFHHGAPPQRHLGGGNAVPPAAPGAGRGCAARHRRLYGVARQGTGTRVLGHAAGTSCGSGAATAN